MGVDVAAAVDNVDQYIGLTNVVQESVSFPTTFENICAGIACTGATSPSGWLANLLQANLHSSMYAAVAVIFILSRSTGEWGDSLDAV